MTALKKTKLVTVSLWALVFLWLLLIFILSAQPAIQSKGFSEKVTAIVVETIAWVLHVDVDAKTLTSLVKKFHHIVRKLAHGWIYFVLGLLVIITFIKTGIRISKAYIFSILFCISYAVVDEIHQTFVSGRGGQITDVLIDTVGAMLGISIYWLYNLLKKFFSAAA